MKRAIYVGPSNIFLWLLYGSTGNFHIVREGSEYVDFVPDGVDILIRMHQNNLYIQPA